MQVEHGTADNVFSRVENYKFTNVRVPKENILGKPGRGLQAALTVLNYGRVTFGATCTGHAKVCLSAMAAHARGRVQFQAMCIAKEIGRAHV